MRRLGLFIALATLLLLVELGPKLLVTAEGPHPPPPAAGHLEIGPPRRVTLAELPPSEPEAGPPQAKPFVPLDPVWVRAGQAGA